MLHIQLQILTPVIIYFYIIVNHVHVKIIILYRQLDRPYYFRSGFSLVMNPKLCIYSIQLSTVVYKRAMYCTYIIRYGSLVLLYAYYYYVSYKSLIHIGLYKSKSMMFSILFNTKEPCRTI